MHQETELLVQAIQSLKQESNIFKDYLFPLVTGFFSALLGAGVAYYTLKYQEGIRIEKEKMNAINKLTLTAESALSSLVGFKMNYHGTLDSDPYNRALKIPTILNTSSSISDDLSALYFIAQKKEDKGRPILNGVEYLESEG